MTPLELWGGHECTLNRVGDDFIDQTVLSGHQARVDDLDLFAGLGVKALRYPALWERISPDRPDVRDWRWTDERLARLRSLNVRPILGLVHHGSGPRYTNLLDEGFAPGLAAHAGAVAERYPWVRDWTPVNEPLTTARFSALYGHWYPHVRDETAFWTALLNQVDATRLSMRAIRAVNPTARLIQTEDLGKTYSTRAVAHQASFDNDRRWMSWDLLCGAVVPGHPLWERLERFGLSGRLAAIADDPCPPDVIGVNHYLTSERFLDHRLERYPPDRRGGNPFVEFADVEAVRVLQPQPEGLEGVLQEAWDRYRIPLAVTETHNGCTREEQMRWTREAWDVAGRLQVRGVPVEAVTAWALLGSHDWNSLLTRQAGHYECGVFDVRGPQPRPTAVAGMLAALAGGGSSDHPALDGEGWWRRDIRLQFQPVFRSTQTPEPRREWRAVRGVGRPVLIAGATGTLGKALARSCEWRNIGYMLTDRRRLDLADPASIAAALEAYDPWAVINAAGWVRVDDAEAHATACHDANALGAERLARACAERSIGCLGFSSDLVFDGRAGRPYVESDPTNPLNAYGASKADAERLVAAAHPGALMIRTAAFFSPYDPYNFAAWVVRELSAGREIAAAEDAVVSPTYVPDLVDAALDLLVDGDSGIWHLANQGAVSWAAFAREIAGRLDLDTELIRGCPAADMGWPARRPAFVPLASERGALLPTLDNALDRYAAALRAADFSSEVEARIDREEPQALPLRPRVAESARP